MIARPKVGRRKYFIVQGVKVFLIVVTSLLFILDPMHAAASRRDQGEQDEVLRIHFLAHSDLPSDQSIKLQVRDAILNELASWQTTTMRSRLEALILERQALLVDVARKVIEDEGLTHPVSVEVGPRYFSERSYGGKIYPAGTYPSVLIVIGDGAGENWWCVLFPPLCFIDEEQPSDDSDLVELQGIVHDAPEPENQEIKWRLRLWETIAQGAYTERVRDWLKVAWGGVPPNENDQP